MMAGLPLKPSPAMIRILQMQSMYGESIQNPGILPPTGWHLLSNK